MVNSIVLLNEDSKSHEVAIDSKSQEVAVHPVESSVPIVVSDGASKTVCISFLFIYSVSKSLVITFLFTFYVALEIFYILRSLI